VALFEPNPDSQSWKARIVFWLSLASLFATGWIVCRPALVHLWPHYTVALVLMHAVVTALEACVAGGAITFVLYLLLLQDREGVVQATLRTSKAAVWFAPAVILMADLQPAALVAALVLVVSATRVLYEQWRTHAPPAPALAAPSGLFAGVSAETPFFLTRLAAPLAASFCAQAGLAAIVLHHEEAAGVALAAGAAILTVFSQTSRAIEPRRPASVPRSVLGLLLTLVLAITLTVGGMMPRLVRHRGGYGGSGHDVTVLPTAVPPGATESAKEKDEPPTTATADADGGFPGVILWPEIKPYATLIAPTPQTHGLAPGLPPRPVGIPFSGEYWMYRWPFAHPPKTSFFQRGSPAKLSFSTTDHRPMQMEARHKLDQSIALDCCAAIQVEIRNADLFPGSINLELVLIDGESDRHTSVRLGTKPVVSRPTLTHDETIAASETLEFPLPASAPISSFNEFKVTFWRDWQRADKSARVAIERFVLVPRM
jgi:hypothetical protein